MKCKVSSIKECDMKATLIATVANGTWQSTVNGKILTALQTMRWIAAGKPYKIVAAKIVTAQPENLISSIVDKAG